MKSVVLEAIDTNIARAVQKVKEKYLELFNKNAPESLKGFKEKYPTLFLLVFEMAETVKFFFLRIFTFSVALPFLGIVAIGWLIEFSTRKVSNLFSSLVSSKTS